MPRLILSRLATGVPTLLVVSLCVFAIVRLIPGDPARLLAGDFATEQFVDELRQRWRLDDPLPVQYVAYVGGVLRGDLGRSISTSTPVLPELVERFLRTLQLAVAGIAVAAVIGIAAGIVSAVRRATLIDYLATALALTGISTPIFWSGLILILLFSVTLEWLPAGGTGTLRHLVLPAVSLGLFGAGVLARQTRSGLLEVGGAILVFAAAVVMINLLVDLSYGALDPRVRPE
jgi:ABC-type dipeptide/oligopeptide/nickel transport system permease component